MRTIVFLLSALVVTITAAGQRFTLGPSDLPGIEMTRCDSFSGTNLFGYINGGADIYLEYGFQKVVISEYQMGGELLKLEIWVMKSAPAAFGIYSLNTYRCLTRDALTLFSCESKYQSAAAYGNLYISAVNRSGTDKGREACNAMVRIVINTNHLEILELPAPFRDEKLASRKSSFHYYSGPLGIQNGIPEWSEMLNGINFSMYTSEVGQEQSTGTLAYIIFSDAESRMQFLSNAGLKETDPGTPVQDESGLFHSYILADPVTLIYIESQEPDTEVFEHIK